MPESTQPPPNDTAGGATAWDRLESDIKAMQQQAMATQKAIQQLQTHEPTGPMKALQSSLPALPTVDSTVIGVAGVLGMTMALLWWFLWYRPQTRLNQTLGVPAASVPPPPAQRPAAASITPKVSATRAMPTVQTSADATQADDPDTLFARHDPNPGFDSEAAASEVVRVRKFLAKKREARALQRGCEGADVPVPSVRAWLDQEVPEPEPEPETTLPPPATMVQDAPDIALDLALDEPTPPEPTSLLALEPESAPEPVHISEPEPEPQAYAQSERSPGPDYAITLALAQESEALDLWPEARELAGEVLESSDASLRAQAQALLERLDQLEHTLAQESLPPQDEP